MGMGIKPSEGGGGQDGEGRAGEGTHKAMGPSERECIFVLDVISAHRVLRQIRCPHQYLAEQSPNTTLCTPACQEPVHINCILFDTLVRDSSLYT